LKEDVKTLSGELKELKEDVKKLLPKAEVAGAAEK